LTKQPTQCSPIGSDGDGRREQGFAFGPNNRFRVFYDIDHDSAKVSILAIGEKVKNRLFVGEEEVNL